MAREDEDRQGLGKRLGIEAAKELARSEKARELVKDLAQSETAREIARELAASETVRAIAREFAKEAAKETLAGTGQKIADAAKRITEKIFGAVREEARKADERRAEQEERRAEERRALEIEDELAALKKRLDDH
jgi:uncharacterized surface anchored protein